MVTHYIDIHEKKYGVEHLGILFYFTSERAEVKFRAGLEQSRTRLETNLFNRVRMNLDLSVLAAFEWYRKCEQNDFLVTIDGRDFNDWRMITLVSKYAVIGNAEI